MDTYQMTPTMIIHVTFGGVAILAGFIGLLSKKGFLVHRMAGRVFVVSMLAMAIAGSFIAFQKPEMITLLAGLFTIYLVISAIVTVRSTLLLHSWQGFVIAFCAFCIGLSGIYYGYQANISADNLYDGFPAAPYLFFGGLALLSAGLDLKIIVQKHISGAHKIARHAWRMCLALFIAAGSLFDGPGTTMFPDALQGSSLLLAPQGIVVLLLAYWLFRILYLRKFS
jgi:uncharacterized membrane protein